MARKKKNQTGMGTGVGITGTRDPITAAEEILRKTLEMQEKMIKDHSRVEPLRLLALEYYDDDTFFGIGDMVTDLIRLSRQPRRWPRSIEQVTAALNYALQINFGHVVKK